MDEYQFRVVLSGPCAYVPNRIVGEGTAPTSWSAIMPQLKLGKTVGGVSLAPHFTVLQYPTALFKADFDPSLVFKRRGEPEFAVVVLAGERIRIDSTEKPAFRPNVCGLSKDDLKAGGKPENRACLDWLPAIEGLLTGSGTFGRTNKAFFDPDGFADGGAIAAHILLDRGDLIADSLVPKEFVPPTQTPGIWGFRVDSSSPKMAEQSVAYTVALQVDKLSQPVKIIIETAGSRRTVTLRQDVELPPVVEVEIKNREFDEIVRLAEGEISVGDVDHDFKVLYFLSQNEAKACPLPFLVKDGGVGTRRATCGGSQFVGFNSSFKNILTKW